jgi:putative transcriptional regulator
MTIEHHPDEELLLAARSGAANEAMALLVSAHASLCERCRAIVGNVVAANREPETVDRAFESVLARLDATSAAIVREAHLESEVPPPLQRYIGMNYDDVPWRAITSGYSQHRLFEIGETRVRLARAVHRAPGRTVHTHSGREWMLVLSGGFSDINGHYNKGDVLSATRETEHEPIADPGVGCINLTVTEGPLLFRKLMPRIMGRLFGF